MSIKKVCGTVAALVLFSGYSSAVFADCLYDSPWTDYDRRMHLADDIARLAFELRCEPGKNLPDFEGDWKPDNPIWKFKKNADEGCTVHFKLSKQLDELEENTTNRKKNRNNGPRGAAEAVRRSLDDSAYNHLTNFIDVIMYSAKESKEFENSILRTGGEPDPAGVSVEYHADDFYLQADDLRTCLMNLDDSTLTTD